MGLVDTCIQNGLVLNVFTREFELQTLWINKGKIVSVGDNDNLKAQRIIDASNQYLVPGFIDAHVHIESAMVSPSELAKVLLKHGVTTIVTDPHEIGNVMGNKGIEYMIEDARQTPLDVKVMLPSSVPCVPFDHSGAVLNAVDLKPLYRYPEVNGLAEVMDFPAVASQSHEIMQKIKDAQEAGYHADGHGAGLTPEQLDTYRQVGIDTDHEATSVQEVKDRLSAGYYVFLREGTVERDIENTIGAVTESNAQRLAFCTDDKLITDLDREGSIDYCIQLAIKHGVRPETAFTMASFNAANAHKLNQTGALATGYQADIVFLDNLKEVTIDKVMKNGEILSEFTTQPARFSESTVHHDFKLEDLKMPLSSNYCNVIQIQPNHIVTDHLQTHVKLDNGQFNSDIDQDILKMVVIERHHNLGTYGLGLVKGFDIQNGAVAITVAHDSHNLVAVGTDDSSINEAIQAVTKSGGGIAVTQNGKVLAMMPLKIAGLMSAKSYQEAQKDLDLVNQAYQKISTNRVFDPFITLSFLTLPVIPSIKLTDQGLYDFNQQDFISVEAK
ncbi:adenine deaminase [Holzapfeliella floricola]|uniref:Adenine deaminase n=1 Tax=Holzapfeliella floricola DSM 23037 = JCM 16512 TaxID=1423744 RepID=A0A0R2DIU8_9LACO|nr:adenine deaminase [Holzapfeliella floricola]KRN04015.1 adenine deaminase [Holzapfeliella floricola DSM 23037 = JCM 16512]